MHPRIPLNWYLRSINGVCIDYPPFSIFTFIIFITKLGNKYYESKNGKRWVIYANTIDASKIPVEWYSWMHFTPNKIEKTHELKKYDWQKPHQSNLTGTEKAYYPNKDKDGIKKKYSSWK